MLTAKKPYIITRGKVIIDYSGLYCDTAEQLLRSELFEETVDRFIERIAARESSIFAFLKNNLHGLKRNELTGHIVNLFRLLSSHTAEEIIAMNSEFKPILSEKEYLHEFIEELYNYWRRFERFIYLEAPQRSRYSKSSIHHAQFIKLNEEFKNLVLYVYRRISENLTGKNPRVYRQLPAGANMGMLLERIDWDCPEPYATLKNIPFIRLSLIEPPLILYPAMNKRKGEFKEIPALTKEMLLLNPDEWFCFPAKVGDLTAFIYFHRDFISLGLTMSNLFEIADYEDIEGRMPDLMLIFGLTNDNLTGDTVFYEDKGSGTLIGLVRHSEEVDYFGYFKKMTLTLHNIVMLKRGRLPVHGAMVYIKLKSGGTANVVIIGDSGAGKSETLEALRALSEEHICEMRIIFDDMGSLGLDGNGRVAGYGTEIGAFVRLDDLQPGYAYEEIDRSVFMNPDKTNARLVMPITRYHHIVKGYPVDMLLYANNYEQVDDEHPAIEFFSAPEEAISVFRSGARLAKGTTDEKGLVHTYFANPFGAPQRKEEHEKCAVSYFEKMFKSGTMVGQIRTRLGIEGFEQIGPRSASIELFKVIKRLPS
ncbi:Phosphoenolpyruvate carboxykinase [ATP] [hydrothermal vent metagenome]|uniref:Phosphoenolpyruvate carboxykinase [ATP] n=1 Tax=hydrothermal vent metagenome TaxID=652676 RepID=A0A3B1D6U9_9ZZZZ